MIHDDDLKAALEVEARQVRVPADEILDRIAKSKVHLRRQSFWQRLGIAQAARFAAALLVLGTMVLAPWYMRRQPIRQNTGVVEVAQVHLTDGTDHVTIKPGQTAELPAGPIYVTLEFNRLIDSSSVRVQVAPLTWHLQPRITPNASSEYLFVIRPDPEVAGRVTVTVDGVKTPEGASLLEKPVSFDVETTLAKVEQAVLPHPLADLIEGADHVTVQTVGAPDSRTEFMEGEREWLMEAAQSAAARSETDLGHGSGPMVDYQLEIGAGEATYWVRWSSTQWFTVTWTEGGRRKAAGFAQTDERLITAISEVLAARQRGTGLR